MNLDQIIEKFAILHKDFSHNPAANAKTSEKAFYRVGPIEATNEFCRNFTTAHSPAIAFSNLVDAKYKNGSPHYQYTFYILAKAKGKMAKSMRQDDQASYEIREQMNGYVEELLTWLRTYCRKHNIRGIDIEGTEWAGIPMMYNGWWVTGVDMAITTQLPKCLNESHFYDEDEVFGLESPVDTDEDILEAVYGNDTTDAGEGTSEEVDTAEEDTDSEA